jgi:hypothetical protein
VTGQPRRKAWFCCPENPTNRPKSLGVSRRNRHGGRPDGKPVRNPTGTTGTGPIPRLNANRPLQRDAMSPGSERHEDADWS